MDLAFWVSRRKKERKSPMKKLSIIIVLLCASLVSIAQDVIVKKDGTTIQSKVMEINGNEIRYKKWSNQEGPMYSISRSEVNSINYQNGEVELITSGTDVKQSLGLTNGRMIRDGRDLVLNGRELTAEEVRELVGEQNYQTYLGARKQIGVGRAFTPVFWVSLGATVALIASAYIYPDVYYSYGYYYEEPSSALLLAGSVTGVVADVSLPLMCIFKGIGKGRMNWVADEYNRNGSASAFSYQFSPSIMKCNSVESQNNLGLGLTFSVSF